MGCKICRKKRQKFQVISSNKDAQSITINQIPQTKNEEPKSSDNIKDPEIKPIENNIQTS